MAITLEYVSPESLATAEYNPRKISPASLKALADLLDAHGFVNPVVARREDRLLIGGHQRLAANKLRKKPDRRIPCVFLEGVGDVKAKELNIALNNDAAQGRFDVLSLAELLAELRQTSHDVAAATGFTERQLQDILAALEPVEPPAFAEAPPPPPPVEPPILIIFEMTAAAFARHRAQLDALVAAEGVVSHVRLDDVDGEATR